MVPACPNASAETISPKAFHERERLSAHPSPQGALELNVLVRGHRLHRGGAEYLLARAYAVIQKRLKIDGEVRGGAVHSTPGAPKSRQ